MPQPLCRVVPRCSVIMCNAGDRPLRHNPELGLLAMEAIISWSNVEQFMLNTYITLLGGPSENAAIAYLAIEIQSAKLAAINAVAQHKLAPRYYSLLQAILREAKKGQKARDKLAHWVWGYSPQIPDGYLLADPRKNATAQHREHIYVYKAPDFQEIIDLNDRVCGYGLSFRYILTGHPANRDDRLYHELCVELGLHEKSEVGA